MILLNFEELEIVTCLNDINFKYSSIQYKTGNELKSYIKEQLNETGEFLSVSNIHKILRKMN